MEIITSVENQIIKEVCSLQEKKYRRFYGKFVVEGPKFVREAVYGGGQIDKVFVLASKIGEYGDILSEVKDKIYAVNEKIFAKISDTENSQGILAEIVMPERGMFVPNGDDILVLDRISDPGNMGTIIRTAAATGYNTIIVLDCVDHYNPKVVRSSAGGIFYTIIYPLGLDEAIDVLKSHNYKIIIADARGENVFRRQKPPSPNALVIGNEANGPCEKIKAAADVMISLPMKKQVESLNAGVSASVLMYELKKDSI